MTDILNILKSFVNWCKDSNHQRFLLLISLVVVIFLALQQCSDKNTLENQMTQNQYALKDSIHQMTNKLDEIYYSKAVTVSNLSELKELNTNLFNEINKMKGTIAEISNVGVQIVYVEKPIYSTLIKYPDGSFGIDWSDTIKNYSDYYRELQGISHFKIDSTKNTIIPENINTKITKDSTFIKLVTGIWKSNISNKWEIFIKNSNPNIHFNLEGHIIDDEISKISSKFSPTKWHLGLHGGVGLSNSLIGNNTMNVNFGWNLGMSIQYSLIDFDFWPFK